MLQIDDQKNFKEEEDANLLFMIVRSLKNDDGTQKVSHSFEEFLVLTLQFDYRDIN